MVRKRDDLAPAAEALAGLGGPVKVIREAAPGARRGFTLSDQVELPRFGGHLRIWEKGVHNGKESILVPA